MAVARQGVRSVGLLPAGSVLFAVLALVGLANLGPLDVSALTALAWALVSVGCGAADLRRTRDEDSARTFVASVGLAVGLVAVVASAIAVVSLLPCGRACL